ncbi:FeoA family protein [Faecalispora anaeroviscerum]|uniref:FeoA family protein n=1 Tax=Faecalispora anaeroviscerum TaxID=2991836 RepID=UPI0024B99489|nr:FeoA family protein [Faecalispora anaeroviscerum]
MPLTMAKAGEKNLIKRVTGKDEVRRFLATLGFVEGESVTVISEIAGNMILNIKDTRVALDKSMANRIMI